MIYLFIGASSCKDFWLFFFFLVHKQQLFHLFFHFFSHIFYFLFVSFFINFFDILFLDTFCVDANSSSSLVWHYYCLNWWPWPWIFLFF